MICFSLVVLKLSVQIHISRQYLCICHIWVFPHRKYQRLSGCRLHFGLLAFWDIFFSQSTKITLVHFLQFLYSGHQFQELKKSSIYLKRFPYLLKKYFTTAEIGISSLEESPPSKYLVFEFGVRISTFPCFINLPDGKTRRQRSRFPSFQISHFWHPSKH